LIIESRTTEKVLQFIIPLESVCIYNCGFNAQKCFFEHCREVQTITNLLIGIIFATISFLSVDLFRAALYRFMLVLNNDALFHWRQHYWFWCSDQLTLPSLVS